MLPSMWLYRCDDIGPLLPEPVGWVPCRPQEVMPHPSPPNLHRLQARAKESPDVHLSAAGLIPWSYSLWWLQPSCSLGPEGFDEREGEGVRGAGDTRGEAFDRPSGCMPPLTSPPSTA